MRFCWMCERMQPIEGFSGRNHGRHLCRECSRQSRAERDRRQRRRSVRETLARCPARPAWRRPRSAPEGEPGNARHRLLQGDVPLLHRRVGRSHPRAGRAAPAERGRRRDAPDLGIPRTSPRTDSTSTPTRKLHRERRADGVVGSPFASSVAVEFASRRKRSSDAFSSARAPRVLPRTVGVPGRVRGDRSPASLADPGRRCRRRSGGRRTGPRRGPSDAGMGARGGHKGSRRRNRAGGQGEPPGRQRHFSSARLRGASAPAAEEAPRH